MANTTSNTHAERVVEQVKNNSKARVEMGWKKNIVKDINAPAYYSQQAIWGFSTFFTVIFGAVLLCINLKGNTKGQWMVIGFAVLYSALTILILASISRNSGLVITINAMGGFILTQLFWDKYVGEDTKYRTKSVLWPLIISIVIVTPITFFFIYTNW